MYQRRQSPPAWANSDLPGDEAGLLALIRDRRSIHRYRKKQVDMQLVDQVIDAAVYAPSAHNAQPWRFFVVVDKEKKTVLAEQMAARFRHDLEKDGVPVNVISKKVQRSVRVFGGAPVVVIAGIDMTQMDEYPDPVRRQAEMLMATQSLAAAIQNLLLAASAAGLGGCWYCAPLFCPAAVKAALSLPAPVLPQALITLGYPAESPATPPRLKLDEIRFIV